MDRSVAIFAPSWKLRELLGRERCTGKEMKQSSMLLCFCTVGYACVFRSRMTGVTSKSRKESYCLLLYVTVQVHGTD